MQENQEHDIHIGRAVRHHLQQHGTSMFYLANAWLARQVECDQSNLCKHLQHPHVYPELLLKISLVLKTDFFALYSDFISKASPPSR
ncbi:MAG: hypothetical protein LBR55_01140 [Bacteroidales bacterium]|jgi:hypothetical protein|nr:hypothetical protein [Bacteroidales bacterium]